MQKSTLAVVVGGLLPAILFGVSGLFQKTSARAGIGTGPYLVVVGMVVVIVGTIITAIQRNTNVTVVSAAHASVYAVLWAAGIACIAIAIARYDAQISQLVPLYNMNTLVAVVIGLVAFSEWRNVQVGRLLLATALIITGGILAASSSK